MSGTFNGLAIPSHGGFIGYGHDGTTAQWHVSHHGLWSIEAYHNPTNMAEAAAMRGASWHQQLLRLKCTINGTTAGTQTLGAYLIHESGTCAGQMYAGEFWFQGDANLSMTGYRLAGIQIVMDCESTYGMVDAGVSFINFYALDKEIPALFTILGASEDAGLFVAATNVEIDHALKIYVDNVVYYIGLYDSKTGSS